MNKADLVSRIAEKTGQTRKSVELIVDSFLSEVMFALGEGEDVKLSGFGNFELRERKGHYGTNPNNNNEKIFIESTRNVGFKPGKLIKEIINQ